jgi:hypothetical protein
VAHPSVRGKLSRINPRSDVSRMFSSMIAKLSHLIEVHGCFLISSFLMSLKMSLSTLPIDKPTVYLHQISSFSIPLSRKVAASFVHLNLMNICFVRRHRFVWKSIATPSPCILHTSLHPQRQCQRPRKLPDASRSQWCLQLISGLGRRTGESMRNRRVEHREATICCQIVAGKRV